MVTSGGGFVSEQSHQDGYEGTVGDSREASYRWIAERERRVRHDARVSLRSVSEGLGESLAALDEARAREAQFRCDEAPIT